MISGIERTISDGDSIIRVATYSRANTLSGLAQSMERGRLRNRERRSLTNKEGLPGGDRMALIDVLTPYCPHIDRR